MMKSNKLICSTYKQRQITAHTLAIIFAVPLLSMHTAAETLSLDVNTAVERALKLNPALRISKASMDERTAASWQATTTLLPRVDLNGNFQKTDPGFFPEQATFITETQYSAQLRASHTLFSGGSVLGQAQAARALASAARHDYQATTLNTAHTVKTAFYDALLAQKLVEVAEEAVEINKEELRRVKVQFDIGEAAKINVLRAEVKLANSIPEMLNARHNLRLAKANLANLIAFDIDESDADVTSLKLEGQLESSRRLELPTLGRLMNAALENRAELKSAESAVSAARGESRASWSGVLPRVDVYGAYNWSNTENTFRVFDTLGRLAGEFPIDFDLNGWQVGATASMPLFNFFGNVKGVQAGKAKVRRAEIAEEDLRRRIELEVRSAYSSYIESAEAVTSQEKNVERARESLRLARQSQSAGEATQLDVQQAQLDLAQAQSLSAQANRSLLVAESALLTAIGFLSLDDAARYGVAVQQ